VVLEDLNLMDILMLLELHMAAPLPPLTEVHKHVRYFLLCIDIRCRYNPDRSRHKEVHMLLAAIADIQLSFFASAFSFINDYGRKGVAVARVILQVELF
jgi:hypothetical protein